VLYYKEIFENGATIGIWKIEENVEDLLSFFSEKQSEYRTEISRFQYPKRKLEFLAVRLLLKEFTGNENGICYNSNRIPSLVDDKFKISISHTDGYASVIMHPSANVGVDIEQKRDKIVRLKHKFLGQDELENIDRENELEHLLLHWSAKETMFKMMGEMDVDFISHLHISPFFPFKEGTIDSFETKSEKQQRFSLNYKVHDDYVLVWGVIN
jgi:phosphopantetheinyl transferase